jgi:hypothetical protein
MHMTPDAYNETSPALCWGGLDKGRREGFEFYRAPTQAARQPVTLLLAPTARC